jgi:hypothetical protein
MCGITLKELSKLPDEEDRALSDTGGAESSKECT